MGYFFSVSITTIPHPHPTWHTREPICVANTALLIASFAAHVKVLVVATNAGKKKNEQMTAE